ncbi:MAG: hypothetical protein JNN04_02575 [Cyclobacteriaceae bacterium]|nr:hypothetical protein [Cyclobacteriaceae bacterium]
MKKRSSRVWAWTLTALLLACQPEMSDDPIPLIAFPDHVINLLAPENQALAVNGGYKEINSIGVRGVILYRQSATTFLAFERNCSFRPNEACATVNVHVSSLYMIDPCCNSTFSFDSGSPTGGMASRPLRQYVTELVGLQLTITDEILN